MPVISSLDSNKFDKTVHNQAMKITTSTSRYLRFCLHDAENNLHRFYVCPLSNI